MTEQLRKAVLAFRVTSAAPVPVRVQFLGGGVPVYPEFSVQPGGNHITIKPDGVEQVEYRASRPRISRYMRLEHGFWLDGAFHLLPEKLPDTPAAAP
jgi:hypothetical protein